MASLAVGVGSNRDMASALAYRHCFVTQVVSVVREGNMHKTIRKPLKKKPEAARVRAAMRALEGGEAARPQGLACVELSVVLLGTVDRRCLPLAWLAPSGSFELSGVHGRCHLVAGSPRSTTPEQYRSNLLISLAA